MKPSPGPPRPENSRLVSDADAVTRRPTLGIEWTGVVLFRLSAKCSIAQEKRLATSTYLIVRLHLPHAIVARLYVRKSDVIILTQETSGTVGV